jgi:hypothetical protein
MVLAWITPVLRRIIVFIHCVIRSLDSLTFNGVNGGVNSARQRPSVWPPWPCCMVETDIVTIPRLKGGNCCGIINRTVPVIINLSLRTMSNSQQGISNIQGKYTKIWSVGNSLLDIGYSVPRKTRWRLRHHGAILYHDLDNGLARWHSVLCSIINRRSAP